MAAIERRRDGSYCLGLGPQERELLRSLPGQLRDLIEGDPDDPSLHRLFPPASPDEAVAHEYRDLMGGDLRDSRLRSMAVMQATVDAEGLSEDELAAWLSGLNDLRLVLGTRLGVDDDLNVAALPPDDPRLPGLALYGYLSWLQEQVVEGLSDAL